jgi:hypothetical protein
MGRMWAVVLSVCLCVGACRAEYVVRRDGPRLSSVDGQAPVLKLHLASGEVYILSGWTLVGGPSSPTAIRGTGQLLGSSRQPVAPQVHVVPISSIVLYETNTRMERSSGALRTLGWVTGTFVALLASLVILLVAVGPIKG